ncbi:hypothetical protein NVV56_09390 [Aeromonas dhakensis]|uniref:hypothetical protein n=1 Tax=Aeromonas dhakensis TaxID=196024 RepID=UPI002157DB7C|nr:hypothetical protein [Aeromonas dhakensis]MCR6739103.1 hypothetical protein [Aeromonas dhakensis]
MSILDKYGLKPTKVKFELDGEIYEFYAKKISFNLAIAIAQQFNEIANQLAIIKFCLCEEDGTMVFASDCDLAEIGDHFPYELIILLSTEIAKMSGPQSRTEDVKKKARQLIHDHDEMFMFDLSVALHIPIFEIKNWPLEIIDQYKAYNHIKHFTKSTDHELTGYMIELLRNQHITKKSDYKSSSELLPFLNGKLPSYLDDPRLVNLRKQMSMDYLPPAAIEDFRGKIADEVQIQMQEKEKDHYFISELIKIYKQYDNNNKEE